MKKIDFKPYNELLGFNLYPHQEEAVKFLTSKKKAILAHDMGFGKTIAAIVSALEGKYEHVLIVAPSSVKETWKRELFHFVNDEDVTIVQGSKWNDAKFTIINYDILDNFYTIPEQTITKRLSPASTAAHRLTCWACSRLWQRVPCFIGTMRRIAPLAAKGWWTDERLSFWSR